MNSKKIGLFIILLVSNIYMYAQMDSNLKEDESPRYLSTNLKVDAGFSGIGLSVETPLSDYVLFEAAAGLGAGYRINKDYVYRFYFDNPAFYSTISGKYYYNQQSRTDNGKSTRFNSGNFFGFKVKYASPTLSEKKTWNTLLTGFHWGLQRKIGTYFLYQFDIGIGASFGIDPKATQMMTLFPDMNFKISYVIPFV